MKRQSNTTIYLIRLAALALVLLAPQTPVVSGRTQPAAQFGHTGVKGPCSVLVGTNFGSVYILDNQSKDPVCQAAIPAFKAAVIIAIGKTPHDGEINAWLAEVAGKPAWKAKFDEGMKFIDALNFLKERLAGGGAADRVKAIDNAFMEVYGEPSKPDEQAYWEAQVKAQKAWYATIVGELRKEMQSNPRKKQLVISRVYQVVFGRAPTAGDLEYWQARNDNYAVMREANCAWLYSPEGAQDLAATTARALQAKTGMKPSNEAVKSAMEKFTNKKLIYEEMVKQ